jgi:hypothetical protein
MKSVTFVGVVGTAVGGPVTDGRYTIRRLHLTAEVISPEYFFDRQYGVADIGQLLELSIEADVGEVLPVEP